jgi:hydroxymethylbilane synthase
MMPSENCSLNITVGARGSNLSKAQMWEVHRELIRYHPHVTFHPTWVTTQGDHDKKTSLRHLEKTDFFTREIDERQLQGEFRIAIHSAKDLPDPLMKGLCIVAVTQGVDSGDVVVYNEALPQGAVIATSSQRREEMVRAWRKDFRFVDVRGTIEERLKQLDEGHFDGLVMAEAALIRLGLTHRCRLRLEGETAPLQGKLAIVALEEDQAMRELFRPLCAST